MNLIYLTVLFPLIGFLLLAFSQGRFSKGTTVLIGCGSIFLSFIIVCLTMIDYFMIDDGSQYYRVQLFNWISVDDFDINFAFMLDGLSLTMIAIVVGIGFLIHLYSAWYMGDEKEGYSRYFAYTNLFIASMLVLVLSDNLLVIFLGWECVGLCSYLLIGFYYQNQKNGLAALKAFLMTKIGDVFLAIGILIIYFQLGTLNIAEVLAVAKYKLPAESPAIFWITLLLFGGAVGKSAQLPLQTWLADAMAGPTPVSALIHAATMVTAGVYLIVRLNGLFILSPFVLNIIVVIGTVTMIIAGLSALVQTDIKRILAYSTMGQLGYMFIAIGVQAWDAAIFHLMIHAFFKALLFLAAGSVIIATNHEQNIFQMGGLRNKMPLVYWAFLVGGGALAALPNFTSGYFSKEAILWGAYSHGYQFIALIGMLGGFLTSLYIFRLIFIVFHGKMKINPISIGGFTHNFPLIILMLLSTFWGALIYPPVAQLLPKAVETMRGKNLFEFISSIFSILGIVLAGYLYLHDKGKIVHSISQTQIGRFMYTWWYFGFFFDALYKYIFVTPFNFIAKLLKNDPINQLIDSCKFLATWIGKACSFSENGYLRWYISSMILGAIVLLTLMLVL